MAFTVFGSDSLAVDHIPTAIQDAFNQIRMMPPSNETGAAAAAAPERTMIDEFVHIAEQKVPAKEDFKYWAGDPQPWRTGTDDSPVRTLSIIASEEKRKAAAEEDDRRRAPTPDAHADMLHRRGVSTAFLVLLTTTCDLWLSLIHISEPTRPY